MQRKQNLPACDSWSRYASISGSPKPKTGISVLAQSFGFVPLNPCFLFDVSGSPSFSWSSDSWAVAWAGIKVGGSGAVIPASGAWAGGWAEALAGGGKKRAIGLAVGAVIPASSVHLLFDVSGSTSFSWSSDSWLAWAGASASWLGEFLYNFGEILFHLIYLIQFWRNTISSYISYIILEKYYIIWQKCHDYWF